MSSLRKRGFSGSIWLGVPGARWMIRKLTIEMITSVTILKKAVRMIYAAIAQPSNRGAEGSFSHLRKS